MANARSPMCAMDGHSRDSSGGSITSSPITPTFSSRGHARYPSSTSSLATSPDSPVTLAKSALHDLLEDPAEREDSAYSGDVPQTVDEPFCICDDIPCEHRRPSYSRRAGRTLSGSVPKLRKNRLSNDDLKARHASHHPGLHESLQESLGAHFHRRWPSISKRWHSRNATTSVSNSAVHSAPPSRSSSVRQSLVARLGPRRSVTQPATPSRRESFGDSGFATEWQMSSEPLGIEPPSFQEDPIEHRELASTPLLPPTLNELRGKHPPEVVSPLQSPRIAVRSGPPSPVGTPISAIAVPGGHTQALSTKPSAASLQKHRHTHVPRMSSEIPPLSISAEPDYWSRRLGHANYHIAPEPYMPNECNVPACNQLRQDWESARSAYMRQAARTRENHGPTSEVYRLTAEKWHEIDHEWRVNFGKATAEAEANGEFPDLQALPATQPVQTLPTLNDPENPSRFPAVDEANIVGPMIQYAAVQRAPLKRKATLLRIFTDPVSLLRR